MVTFKDIVDMVKDDVADENEQLYLDINIIKEICINLFNIDTDATNLFNKEPDVAYAESAKISKFIKKMDDNLEIDYDGKIHLPMIEERKRELEKIEKSIDDIFKIISNYKTDLGDSSKEELYNHIAEYFK
jgi:hypothetical protein